MHRCPTCRSPVRPRVENPAFPFCTPRCRAVDLGRWFTGGYSVPGDPAPDAIPDNGEASFAGVASRAGPQVAAYGDESENDAKAR
ncbi:MAG: DNA gyrase inhibitor YacG [Myxococcales bacterium]